MNTKASGFSLNISAAEKEFLLKVARESIHAKLAGTYSLSAITLPEFITANIANDSAAAGKQPETQPAKPSASESSPTAAVSMLELGAFVTLSKNGDLRGCIGNLIGQGALYKTISRMAIAAAFDDPRFPALLSEELPELHFEISVMGAITPCKDPEAIVIGRHGLIICQKANAGDMSTKGNAGYKQGLLLPQVPVEWNWNRETFLEQTCHKAGLQADAWRKAWQEPNTELYWFEAEVFSEHKP